jgi:prevent-host-death family protein
MKNTPEVMQAGKFKAECLAVMDRVRKTRRGIIITKRNVPIAQLVPLQEKEEEVFGSMKGMIHFLGDIISPIDEVWDATT